MPRPVRDETQSVVTGVRLSEREQARLRLAAELNNKSRSAFMREAIEEAISDCLEPLDDERDGICSP